MSNRNGFRWNINECLRLQREFELLQLPLDKIAELHGRSVKAIMFKLHSEGLADYCQLSQSYYNNKISQPISTESNDDEVSELDDEEEEFDDDGSYDPYDFAKNLSSLQSQITQLANYYFSRRSNKKSVDSHL
jgi:hypothetical protein